MLADIQQCPDCSRAIPREQGHKTRPDRDGYFVTRLVCTFCGRGWYTLWEHLAGFDRLDFSIDYREKTEPDAFRHFIWEINKHTGLQIDPCSYAAA